MKPLAAMGSSAPGSCRGSIAYVSCVHHVHGRLPRGIGMEEPRRDLALSCELPPPSPIETSRDVRQVSHCEWALARRTRILSRRLQAQARQLPVFSANTPPAPAR